MAFKLTSGNPAHRQPVPDFTKELIGKLFGDRGYISQELFEKLEEKGRQLITRSPKNMNQKLVKLIAQIWLRQRSLIELRSSDAPELRDSASKTRATCCVSRDGV